MGEEKVYIGTKIIKATPMSKNEFANYAEGSEMPEDQPGYRVTYEDGYRSWSPYTTFERAYREVTEQEKGMLED